MGILIYGHQQYHHQLHILLCTSAADSNYSILPDESSVTPAGLCNVADVAATL